MAARVAAVFTRYTPWDVMRLPYSKRQWLYDYVMDQADYQAEAISGDEDIDVDELMARR